MPNIELITPKENRDFDSSVGNWTGDPVWDPGPIMGREGLVKFEFPDGSWGRSMSLPYPNIKLVIGKEVTLRFLFYWPGSALYGTVAVAITDGNYVYSQYYPFIPSPNEWKQFGIPAFIVPDDFVIPSTVLSVACNTISHAAVNMYFDNFTCSYWKEPRVDHLPLMGMH